MSSHAAATARQDAPSGPYRVMLVDDSAVIRGFFRRALEAEPDIEIVASVGNGQVAVDTLRHTPVDVIVLDIEMPVMDGLTALPRLLEVDRAVKIVMASTLTVSSADVSLRALARGAADYIAKPTAAREIHAGPSFQRELVGKVRALGFARRSRAPAPPSGRVRRGPAPGTIRLRPVSATPAAVLAIGSSTGGPQALMTVLGGLGRDFTLPVLVTQHMPATFTGLLARHIGKAAGREAAEAVDGEKPRAGRIHVAPGDWHMTVEPAPGGPVIRLTRDAPVNFCRPSVDPMMRSLAAVYGDRLLGVMLTGMGRDGLDGCRALAEAGGTLIGQDEASSVVWGMPGAVAAAGLCSAVLPLDRIAGRVRELSGRRAP